MSKKVKSLIERELKSRFENVSDCIVVSVRGVSGIDNNQMRGDFLKKDIHMTVVKNSLARRTFSDLGKRHSSAFYMENFARTSQSISGPTAFTKPGIIIC